VLAQERHWISLEFYASIALGIKEANIAIIIGA
jgi:hypothetical protein